MSIEELLGRLEKLSPNLLDAALKISEEERVPVGSVIELLYSPHAAKYRPTTFQRWQRCNRPAKF
jgi:hypothetical protein